MDVINLRERFGRRFKIAYEESYTAQYGTGARVENPHYQIIPGAKGHVYVWDAERLAASTSTTGNTATRLKALPGVEVWQDGADGCTVLFPLRLLDQIAGLLKLRRRRKVSSEERRRLAKLGQQNQFQPKAMVKTVAGDGFQSDSAARPCDPGIRCDSK